MGASGSSDSGSSGGGSSSRASNSTKSSQRETFSAEFCSVKNTSGGTQYSCERTTCTETDSGYSCDNGVSVDTSSGTVSFSGGESSRNSTSHTEREASRGKGKSRAR